MIMTHPGLPSYWGYIVWAFMLIVSLWVIVAKMPGRLTIRHIQLNDIKLLGSFSRLFTSSTGLLLFIRIIVVALFFLVIYSGLTGTPVPARNIATVLTWNIWWAGLIISIFFLGSAWCAICPWDALANWFVKPRLWLLKMNNSLELKPPRWMRTVWPALLMLIGLTWLELGYGVTSDPYATALLSLLMVVMATLSLAIFRNKAFCHYICPVGRTVGFYAQLAPIELRPIDPDICAQCTGLECFNGTDEVDPCPTQLVMGSLTQNTYCTSCGNCVRSCPDKNISWRLRPQSQEAISSARPHWDEAWFMLILLALTSFHGITMMEFWETWMQQFAQIIGDSGQLLVSFSTGLMVSIIIPVSIYALFIVITRWISGSDVGFKPFFMGLVFVTLPLAFAYHIAHNLNHMLRETAGAGQLLMETLGMGSGSLVSHGRLPIPEEALFAMQGLLMMFGFWVAVKVLRYRIKSFVSEAGFRLTPILVFIISVNGFHLWLLMQPMIMRMGGV
ncbi:MAG: 4Fe-4S binding protein [Gammaproteobacteria bacterium]|nr:4Fe-4S binding protein [Gammaproteobacteria bacterium]